MGGFGESRYVSGLEKKKTAASIVDPGKQWEKRKRDEQEKEEFSVETRGGRVPRALKEKIGDRGDEDPTKTSAEAAESSSSPVLARPETWCENRQRSTGTKESSRAPTGDTFVSPHTDTTHTKLSQ
ncbi:GL14351 [Drosophila persimilis]|uniref:GL14351 n=1 Tax=Drosophila persimilis TaxID=7234 RepID=B4GTH5_DROPE|nr:GL14351 [Drosophila persimilis]